MNNRMKQTYQTIIENAIKSNKGITLDDLAKLSKWIVEVYEVNRLEYEQISKELIAKHLVGDITLGDRILATLLVESRQLIRWPFQEEEK